MSRCKRCNRTLKDPLSIERGYGPVCWAESQAHGPAPSRPVSMQMELEFELPSRLFTPGLSLTEQHKIVKRLLDMK
ncbi:DUF6011 domain-containing protein [Sporomusa sp. KB1]|uniref:DUF6011 domain-containing protein n=1 Tax=Sporomusa sp. KB1 TaxID=943346 RepID=UPI0011A91331|nr:DUF6011 domain-containing protein [Sporomusa sp. KB1]